VDYPFSAHNPLCRLLGHRYGKPYGSESRRTCWLDGHTDPPFGTVPQARGDYDSWVERGKPKDEDGNWVPDPDR
jgi:hypothetical protein